MTFKEPSKVTAAYLNSPWLRLFHHTVLRYYNVLFHSRHRIKVVGQENIPPKSAGSFIVISNHMSTLDPPILGVALRYRQLAFMAKEELFKSWTGRFLYSQLGAFAVNREKIEMSTVRSAKSILESNGEWLLGMFPEGTRNTEGQIGTLKKGVAFIAKTNKCGILPVGIDYQGELTAKGIGRDLLVHIGQFMPYEKDMEIDALTLKIQETLLTLKAMAEKDRIC